MNDAEIIEKYKKYEPFFGNWYIKSFVGEGGFAKVFEIVRNDFGTEYISALKIITVSKSRTEINSMRNEGMSDADIKASMYNIVEDTVKEIQLMYKLKGNGNIVGYEDHAVVEHEGGMGWDILIKMEFLTSLGSYIRQQGGQLTKRAVIKLGIDICKSLQACQKYNIIHRDIKADNIFVSKDGDFKLGDFGIARVIERNDMELSKKGTSTYMAPEVYKGQTYTSAVDIYSLGMVLYRLLNNNRAPFLPPYPRPISLDDRDKALMLRMSGEKLPKPAQAESGRLTEIVLKACAHRPEERYSSPVQMRQDLEAILYEKDEVTNDIPVMVYDEARANSKFTLKSSDPMEDDQDEATGATEILQDEATGVTEVLQDETTGVTEVLGEEDATKETKAAEVKVLCKNCGSAMDRDAPFCPMCGTDQRVDQTPKRKAKPKEKAKTNGVRTLLKNKKARTAAGISAAVLALIVLIAVGGKHDPSDNVLAPVTITHDAVFGNSNIAKEKIITITFLDTLADMPKNAWDASMNKNGTVMAWVEPVIGGYNLYIGGEGGVMAPKDAGSLFAGYINVKEINFNGNFDTSKVESMGGMFDDCSALTNLDLSSFSEEQIAKLGFK